MFVGGSLASLYDAASPVYVAALPLGSTADVVS